MAQTRKRRNPLRTIAAAHRVLFCFLACLASLITVCRDDAAGAEFRILPSLTVSEEYNNNIFLTPTDKVEDYITRVIPAFKLKYTTALWDWDIDYAYDYRYYAKGVRTKDSTHRASLTNRTEPVKDYFIIEMQDQYERVSLDVTRDYTSESLFINQSDRNIFTLNPYLVMKSASRHTPILGYKFTDTRYSEAGVIDSVDKIGYLDVRSDLASNLTFTTGVRYTRDRNDAEDYDKVDVYVGPSYTYAQNSNAYCMIGESFLNFAVRNRTKHVYWNAGINHRYSTITVAFQTVSDYIPDPYRILRREDSYVAGVTKETGIRTSLGLSAGRYEYRNAATNHLENTSYQLTGTIRHLITPASTMVLGLTIDRLENDQDNTFISLYHNVVRLEHRFTNNTVFSLDYLYTNSYSETYSDNYVSHRVTAALFMNF